MALHGEAADLYPHPGELTFYPGDPVFQQTPDEYAKARLLARGNYYNPPALAYLQAPIAALPFRDALWLFASLGMAAIGGYVVFAWRAARAVPELPLLILGVLSFRPLHEAIMMGHIAPFFILALTAGFLLLRSQRQVLAGLCFSLLAFKPQWAVLPALFLLARGEWRAFGTMAAAAAAIFFLPFFATGLDTLGNYYHFLRFSATLDMKDAPHMFSWNGFLSKLDGSEIQNGQLVLFADAPSPALVYGLIALTALPMVVVWYGRDYYLGIAATVVAMLLVSTHSVWYDWSLLAVAALFLILRSPGMSRGQRVEMWVVLLALHLAASQSVAAVLYPDRHFVDWHRSAFFSMTPVAFLSLLWMASLAVRDGQLRPPDRLRRLLPQAAGS
jgi:hypothetical protein